MSFSNDIPSLQNQLPLSIELSKNPNEMREDINDLYQTIASAVNNKVGGLYVPQEKINSQQYFKSGNVQQYRNIYRMVVDFGALPNSGSKSMPHNISGWNSNYRLTSCYGGATSPGTLEAVPVPNEGIFLKINSTSVIITTIIDYSMYTSSTIVIEYAKEP